MSLPLPPALPGMPVLGQIIEFQKRPVEVLQRGYDTLGPIFSLRLGPKRIAVLIGRENNQFFFKMTDRILSLQEVYRDIMKNVFGSEEYTLAAPRESYLKGKKMGLPLYERTMLRNSHLPAMVREATDWIESLGQQGEFDLVNSFGVLTMHIASRALIGNDFREQLGETFRKEFAFLVAGVDYILPANLPLPRFIRRNRARRTMTQMILRAIERRRSEPPQQDTLQLLMSTKDDDGKLIEDATIASIIMQLVFAGHETTQSQLSWTLIQLLQHPQYLARVLQEQDEVFRDGEDLTLEKLDRMVLLDRAMKESERMRPVVRMLLRYNSQSYERSGYQIPKGWFTLISPPVTHHQPELFADPHRYDPDRFSPERDPSRAASASLVGFGGGSHRCLGTEFANTNMKTILSVLLRNLDLQLVDPDPQPIAGMSFRPKQPCLSKYLRRTASGIRQPVENLNVVQV